MKLHKPGKSPHAFIKLNDGTIRPTDKGLWFAGTVEDVPALIEYLKNYVESGSLAKFEQFEVVIPTSGSWGEASIWWQLAHRMLFFGLKGTVYISRHYDTSAVIDAIEKITNTELLAEGFAMWLCGYTPAEGEPEVLEIPCEPYEGVSFYLG